MKSFQVFGVPSTLGYSRQEKTEAGSARFPVSAPSKQSSAVFYDIEARSPGTKPPSDEQVQEMLRGLLADRFNLKLHRERRPFASYALVTFGGSPKLRPATDGCRPQRSVDFIQLCGYTIEQFAQFLTTRSDKIVVDMTDIIGKFDIELPLDQSQSRDFSALAASVSQNVKLKIEPRNDQIDVLVVDHVERPSAN